MRLIVVRHGKSSWDDPALDDHARPLNARGERSADAIGRWLAERAYLPDLALCSTARRARDTWERIAATLPTQPRFMLQDRLYHAEAERLLATVRDAGGEALALVGHNPGLADFVHRLVVHPAEHPRFAYHPTCTTTVIDFAKEAAWGAGRVADFVVPRDLDQELSGTVARIAARRSPIGR